MRGYAVPTARLSCDMPIGTTLAELRCDDCTICKIVPCVGHSTSPRPGPRPRPYQIVRGRAETRRVAMTKAPPSSSRATMGMSITTRKPHCTAGQQHRQDKPSLTAQLSLSTRHYDHRLRLGLMEPSRSLSSWRAGDLIRRASRSSRDQGCRRVIAGDGSGPVVLRAARSGHTWGASA